MVAACRAALMVLAVCCVASAAGKAPLVPAWVDAGSLPVQTGPGAGLMLKPSAEVQVCREGPWKGQAVSLVPSLKALTSADKAAFSTTDKPSPTPFRLEDADGKFLHLSDGGKPVMTYNYGMILKDGVPENRRRSSYVHPIFGLDGEPLSDDFPRDHYHHRGIMWVWPHIRAGQGEEASTWDIRGVQQKFKRLIGKELGPVCATFGVENEWVIGGKAVAKEVVWMRTWRAGPAGRAIDFHLTWTALGEPVTVRGQRNANKGYGGFCHRPMSKDSVIITTSTGVLKKDSLLEPFPWADYSAKAPGRDVHSGLAILIHPGNPGYPNGWIMRHYRFLGCSWPGNETVTFEPGKPVTLQYRVWLHRGTAQDARVKDLHDAYKAMAERKK